MSYKELYERCQQFNPKVSRGDIIPLVEEITRQSVAVRLTGLLDTKKIRGYFLSSANSEHPIVKQHGGKNVIVIARDLNYCWQRMVEVKECMHLFDTEEEKTSTPESFEKLLSELSGAVDPMDISQQLRSETRAFWMALAVFCPEKDRLDLQEQRKLGRINDYGIAVKLRIPEQYVNRLFVPSFPNIIKDLNK